MKKKLLFVIESLNLGGAEKSLTTLLNLLDYDKYDVDLQLFSYGGAFQKLLPKEVNLLPELKYFSYCNIPYKNVLKKLCDLNCLKAQLKYSIQLRLNNYNHIQKAVSLWKNISSCLDEYNTKYDVAIAYAQGLPTFYVANKIKASKKIAWINATYIPEGRFREFVNKQYSYFNNVNCVSEKVEEQFFNTFSSNKDKTVIIKDIMDYEFNNKMSKMESNCKNEMENDCDFSILTVGRIIYSKGYDLAVEACKILKEKKYSIKWYVIGDGDKREEVKDKINEHKLEDTFILLGAKSNPYPYFKECDIYVQTSRFEGFGITLAEARMFNKPVVTTEFEAVYSQMIQDTNGLVVKMTPEAIADGIEKMINDYEYRNNIIKYLETEKKGNIEEIEKFYKVIE